MANDKLLEDMPHINIIHLPYMRSNHYVMLMEMCIRLDKLH